MRISHSLATLLLSGWILLPSFGWAGGVVQELRTNNTSRSKAENTVEDNHKAVQDNPTGKNEKIKECKGWKHAHRKRTSFFGMHEIQDKNVIATTYNTKTQSLTITWKEHVYQGKTAYRYLIYRRKKGSHSWELIGEVDGTTFKFADHNLTLGESYDYKIVALYQVDGKIEALKYPGVQVESNHGKEGSNSPNVGLGCQSSSTPNSLAWFWLLCLLPLFLRRRTPVALSSRQS